ncbi:hypothetical protein MY11210_003527 [Beauveria gryllotalpidicola]
MSSPALPPDLFDTATLASLAAAGGIVGVAYAASRRALPPRGNNTPPALRFLFVWHLADALCHFILEGSFLYHCFFSYVDASAPAAAGLAAAPHNYLGHGAAAARVYGPQAAGANNPFAQLWMVYARADRRWGGADVGIISLELLTVFFDGPVALYVAYLIAKRDPRASFWMVVLATCELYGGFMTFCPEWLVGNVNLDGSNFMYMWVYLVFFNMLWVFIPLYAVWYSYRDISHAFAVRASKKGQ